MRTRWTLIILGTLIHEDKMDTVIILAALIHEDKVDTNHTRGMDT